MLNPFPELLAFGFFVPAMLRITVAAVFVYLLLTHFKTKKALAGEIASKFKFFSHETAVWAVGLLILAELALAAALFIGFGTQVAALLAALGFIKLAIFRKKMPLYSPLSPLAYTLLVIICLGLLISGAGAFALDLPL